MKKTRKIDTGTLNRSVQIRAEDINEDSREIALSFSSEEPVSRWYGKEILSHEAGAVNLGRLRSGGALLVDHDMRDQVGVVEDVSIDSDRRGHAVVRFGQSARAEEIYQDVLQKIRTNISVGYTIEEMTEDRETDTFTATRWTPLEITITSVPADFSIGIGRNNDSEKHETIVNYTEERTMPEENKTPATPATPTVDVEAVRGDAIKVEQKRTNEMLAIGREYDCADLAETAIRENATVNELTTQVLAKMKDSRALEEPKLDLSDKELKRYSLFNAIRAQESGNWDKAGFELECSRAIQDASGKEARGIWLPTEVQDHAVQKQRVMTVESATAGGYLVNDEPQSMVEFLYANTVVGQLGATYLNGLVGDVPIPKMTGSSTMYWLSEDEDGTNSEPTIGQIILMPKTVSGAVPMSRKLMQQSNPSVEAMVMNDLNRGVALAMDDVCLSGDGFGGQPLGILNHTGISTSTISSAGAPTWTEAVEFESDIDTSNALMGNLNWVTTPAVKGNMKTTEKATNTAVFLMGGDNQVNGYDVHTTTQLAADTILFGDFSSLIVGMWGSLDVVADTSTKAASGGLVLRVFQDADVGVRHIESFCKNV